MVVCRNVYHHFFSCNTICTKWALSKTRSGFMLNIKQYEKKGGYAQAMRDFNKIEGKLKKIVTDKGTVFVKINSKGNVTLYPVARTGGVPTLNYKEKEKIRYK